MRPSVPGMWRPVGVLRTGGVRNGCRQVVSDGSRGLRRADCTTHPTATSGAETAATTTTVGVEPKRVIGSNEHEGRDHGRWIYLLQLAYHGRMRKIFGQQMDLRAFALCLHENLSASSVQRENTAVTLPLIDRRLHF